MQLGLSSDNAFRTVARDRLANSRWWTMIIPCSQMIWRIHIPSSLAFLPYGAANGIHRQLIRHFVEAIADVTFDFFPSHMAGVGQSL